MFRGIRSTLWYASVFSEDVLSLDQNMIIRNVLKATVFLLITIVFVIASIVDVFVVHALRRRKALLARVKEMEKA